MDIAAVSYRAPSRKLSNDDVLEHIDRLNPNVSRFVKRRYLSAVQSLFNCCGASSRHWRDIDRGEKAAHLILGAIDDALAKANMRPADIDLLIFCGVGKGFLEPANAYFYAKAKGMHKANCFDVTDACMSWIRALETAYLMLRAGRFKRAMIINGECHLGMRDNWEIRGIRSLAHTFPMYTIGEAATATIVTASEQTWQFEYDSLPELADLCTIPLEGYQDFVDDNRRIGLNGINRFVSFGKEILGAGASLTSDLITRTIDDLSSKDWYFPHAPSKAAYENVFNKMNIPLEKLYLKVFPNFGNVVSASIPVALTLAEREGELRRGDQVALVPASAGMVAAVVQFTY